MCICTVYVLMLTISVLFYYCFHCIYVYTCVFYLIGKSSTLSMITRDLLPTAGDAYINGHSVLSAFSLATRYKCLWCLRIIYI